MSDIVNRIVDGLEKDGKHVSEYTKEKMEEIMRLIDEVIEDLKK